MDYVQVIHYLSPTGLSWDAILKITKIKLEILT